MTYRHSLRRAGHPLATKHGRVRQSRLVMWANLEGEGTQCELCHRDIYWTSPINDGSYLVVDHIDNDVQNDDPSNLRALCRNCNGVRGKVKPVCPRCGSTFSRRSGGQVYCSKECAFPFAASQNPCPICGQPRKRVEAKTCSAKCGQILRWNRGA
jgi:predicted nucleic acid-binding Zn ribbon protein